MCSSYLWIGLLLRSSGASAIGGLRMMKLVAAAALSAASAAQ
jgi:hypothetical protein